MHSYCIEPAYSRHCAALRLIAQLNCTAAVRCGSMQYNMHDQTETPTGRRLCFNALFWLD